MDACVASSPGSREPELVNRNFPHVILTYISAYGQDCSIDCCTSLPFDGDSVPVHTGLGTRLNGYTFTYVYVLCIGF